MSTVSGALQTSSARLSIFSSSKAVLQMTERGLDDSASSWLPHLRLILKKCYACVSPCETEPRENGFLLNQAIQVQLVCCCCFNFPDRTINDNHWIVTEVVFPLILEQPCPWCADEVQWWFYSCSYFSLPFSFFAIPTTFFYYWSVYTYI